MAATRSDFRDLHRPVSDLVSDLSLRKIIHVDMDAFYASVEQRDHPELRGKALVVGGDPNGRGVIASASYEARKYGVRSAMSSRQALRLCPKLVFVRPKISLYAEVSEQLHAIFKEVSDWVEPLSLDEAYLDVTENKLNEPIATKVAKHIKDEIKRRLNLTASAGVGPNKFIAKIASDLKKPDGLVVIRPHEVSDFLLTLPIEKLWGVGPVTAKKLNELGFKTAGDIRRAKLQELEKYLGKFGAFLHDLSRGHDPRPVEPYSEPKSRGAEETFESDVLQLEVLEKCLAEQSEGLVEELKEMDCFARTVTIKVRYSDFKTITRSHTFFRPTQRLTEVKKMATELLMTSTEAGRRPVRLLGVSLSGFIHREEPQQLWLDLPLP